MSQPWATICIQVPMLEVQAPTHMRRKSRYSNALKVLRTVVSTTAVATESTSRTVSEWTDEWGLWKPLHRSFHNLSQPVTKITAEQRNLKVRMAKATRTPKQYLSSCKRVWRR